MYRIDELYAAGTAASARRILHRLRNDLSKNHIAKYVTSSVTCFTPLGLTVVGMLGVVNNRHQYAIPIDVYLSLFAEEP